MSHIPQRGQRDSGCPGKNLLHPVDRLLHPGGDRRIESCGELVDKNRIGIRKAFDQPRV